jgi:putative ABC transport system permease protein
MFFSYSVRNLWARGSSTLSAALGVAIVVFMLASVQMFVASIARTASARGDAQRVVVLARGAQVEFTSALGDAEAAVIKTAPGLARGPAGPAVASELVSVVLVPATDGRSVNVQVRGIDAQSLTLRPEVTFGKGRSPQPGSNELAIGEDLVGRFPGAHLGGQIELRAGHPAPVVGVFSDGGSGLASEVWGDFAVVRAQLGRAGLVSSIRARLADGAAFAALDATLTSDPRLAVEVMRETDFNERMATGSTKLVGALGLLVGVFGALAAMFGAMIALNGSVAHRQREIGTMRALGFSPARILSALLTEAVLLALVGGLAGGLASLALGWLEIATTSWTTFAMTVIRLEPKLSIIAVAVGLSALLGVLGGIFPAVSAARVAPATALKRL